MASNGDDIALHTPSELHNYPCSDSHTHTMPACALHCTLCVVGGKTQLFSKLGTTGLSPRDCHSPVIDYTVQKRLVGRLRVEAVDPGRRRVVHSWRLTYHRLILLFTSSKSATCGTSRRGSMEIHRGWRKNHNVVDVGRSGAVTIP